MWRHFEYSRLSSQNLNSVSLSLVTSSFFSALWRCFHDENSGCLVSVAVLPLSLLSTSGLGVGEITMGLVGPIRTGVRLRLLPVATGVLVDVAPFGNTFRKLKVCNETRRRGCQISYSYRTSQYTRGSSEHTFGVHGRNFGFYWRSFSEAVGYNLTLVHFIILCHYYRPQTKFGAR